MTGVNVYDLKGISPSNHMKPLLSDMDQDYFSRRFKEGSPCEWRHIVDEAANYLSLNGVEGGLEYDAAENLSDPSENFIYSVIVQILSLYWLYAPRLDEYLKTVDSDDYQAFYEAVAPFKNVVAEAVARQFNRLSKASEQDLHEGNAKAVFHLQQQAQDLARTVKLQNKALQDYVGKISQLGMTLDDRDKEIKALKEIEEISNIEKEAIQQQRETLLLQLEQLRAEHNDLHERYMRQEDEQYRLLAQAENLETIIKNLRTQELIYQSKERAYEEANQKLKTFDDLKSDYEVVKAANEEKKQFIMFLHAKNKDLQAQIISQMDTIIEHEKDKNMLEVKNQDLEAAINVLENQLKSLRNENLIYKNYNRNLLTNEYLSTEAYGSRRPSKLEAFAAPDPSPIPSPASPADFQVTQLQRENERLKHNLDELRTFRDNYLELQRTKIDLDNEVERLRVKLTLKDKEIRNKEKEFLAKSGDNYTTEQVKKEIDLKDKELAKLASLLEKTKTDLLDKEREFSTMPRTVKAEPTVGQELGCQTDPELLEIAAAEEVGVLYGTFMNYVRLHLDIGGQIRDRNIATGKQLTTYFSMGKLLIPDRLET